MSTLKLALACCFALCCLTSVLAAQEMPADYKQVLDALGRQGDFKEGVLKVNIPRSDLKVAVDGVATPTPFGFGGWVALAKGAGGHDVMMGDLVLTEQEVNPVMSALLGEGLEVTAIHNHFFFEAPRIFYMHVHGHGRAADIAAKLKPALALIGKSCRRRIRHGDRKGAGREARYRSARQDHRDARRSEWRSLKKSPLAVQTSRWSKWAHRSLRVWG